jgi:DNA-binding GntR family transcriptional regulator
MLEWDALAGQLRPGDPLVPQLVQFLRQAIIELRLKPGEGISEKDVAARFGVSRQPVREAFIMLAEAGLVQIWPSRGTFVVKISVSEVLDARFVREAVECALARTAASLIDEPALARLETLLRHQRAAASRADHPGFHALDEEFHREIARVVDSGHAIGVVEAARARTDRVRFLSLPGATPLARLIAQHEAIVVALARRDSAAAEAAMSVHLREILDALPRLAIAHPDFFEPGPVTIPAHARGLIVFAQADTSPAG